MPLDESISNMAATVLDYMGLAALVTDREGRILYVNPKFLQLTGYSLGEVIGQTPRILKSGLTPPHVYRAMWDAILAGHEWHGELSNKRKNGEIYLESLHVSPVRDRDGRITRFVAVWEDITERRRIESLKEEMFETAAHELRSPVWIIRSYALGLMGGTFGALNEPQKQIVSSVEKSARRLSRFVDDTLDIARMEAGRWTLALEETNVARLAADVVAEMQPVARDHNLELTVASPAAEVIAELDGEQISRALRNLVSNAIKFTEHGIVTVEVSPAPDGVQLSVRDTGMGIPAEGLTHLFEKFRRFSMPVRPNDKGSGLGLAITKAIAELHGGTVTALSEPGRGSVFTLYIPRRASPPLRG